MVSADTCHLPAAPVDVLGHHAVRLGELDERTGRGRHEAESVKRHDGFGAGDRNRTRDILLTRRMLYQLSYTGSVRRTS